MSKSRYQIAIDFTYKSDVKNINIFNMPEIRSLQLLILKMKNFVCPLRNL